MQVKRLLPLTLLILVCLCCGGSRMMPDLPENTWKLIVRDETGARRNSSFRYVPEEGCFLLWGYLGWVTEY